MNLEEAKANNPEGREIIDVTRLGSVEPEYVFGMTPAERDEADRQARAAYEQFRALWRAQPWHVKLWRRLHGENHG